jgi:hypothetical protein
MSGRPNTRSRAAHDKDKQEIEEKRKEYSEFAEWQNKGILHDIVRYFGIENPSLQLLLPIAMNLSHVIQVQLGRQEKRRREFLVGWMNKHYEQIQSYIPHLVLTDDKGVIVGPNVEAWNRYKRENPDAAVLKYLAGTAKPP